MEKESLFNALIQSMPKELARDLVEEFISIRRHVVEGNLGGSAPGKFVETVVQILQFLEDGSYEKSPNVDQYLRAVQCRASKLDENLRICAARIARSMYSLRNKRSISHKGQVDPNSFDLRFLHAGAQWIMAELIRIFSKIPMEEAGRLIDQIQLPVGGLIEDFGNRKLVLAELTTRDEILVLLHSNYPREMTKSDILLSLDRRKPDTVRKCIKALWNNRLIEGNEHEGYRLTNTGLRAAIEIISKVCE